MTEPTIDDTIRFEEAGARFEIFGPAVDGTRMVAVTDAAGDLHGHEARSFDDACRFVDEWLDSHLGPNAPGRFKGLRFLIWDHETRGIEESELPTRGRFLEMLDDGTSPGDLADVLEWRQGWGDLVLEIRDGAGLLLLDNRRNVRERFESWNRECLEYDLEMLSARMSGT